MIIREKDTFSKSFQLSEQQINTFADCTTDRNPVHLDEDYAQNTIFKKRIAHGFLVGSFISAVLGNDFPGQGTIYLRQNMNFKKAVFIGDTITVKVTVTAITDKNWLELETLCMNQYDEVVISGEALVIPPKETELIK